MASYLGVWCPTCEQDALPNGNGACGWCDNQITHHPGLKHGTRSRYKDGCRCARCCLIHSRYQREYRARLSA